MKDSFWVEICQPNIDKEIKDDAEICDFPEILKL
jgi:hypothetical protein